MAFFSPQDFLKLLEDEDTFLRMVTLTGIELLDEFKEYVEESIEQSRYQVGVVLINMTEPENALFPIWYDVGVAVGHVTHNIYDDEASGFRIDVMDFLYQIDGDADQLVKIFKENDIARCPIKDKLVLAATGELF